jgi:hypothetical protein
MARETAGDSPHLSLNAPASSPASHVRPSPPAGGAPRLSSDEIEELRSAIERWLREAAPQKSPGTSSSIDEQLRISLRVACAKARLQRVRAEHLVVDLKHLWASIPSVLSSRSDERMNALVSACIDEYYASSPKNHHAAI